MARNKITKEELIKLVKSGGNDADLFVAKKILEIKDDIDEIDAVLDETDYEIRRIELKIDQEISAIEEKVADQEHKISGQIQDIRQSIQQIDTTGGLSKAIEVLMSSEFRGKDGKDGKDGKTPTRAELEAIIIPLIPETEQVSTEEIESIVQSKLENINFELKIDEKLSGLQIKAENVIGIQDILPKNPPMYAGGSGASFLKSMRDVDRSSLESAIDGKVLTWNATKKKFDLQSVSGSGATTLSDLTDVGVTTPTNRNVLVADGDSWESRALTEADISDLGNYVDTSGTPANNQVAVFTDADTIEGNANFTYDSVTNILAGIAQLTGNSAGFTLTTATNGDITIDPAGSGTLNLNAGSGGVNITTDASNADITIDPHGSGSILIGGTIDAQGNNIDDLGDITFQTGATGGTMRTGTSNADKFVLQGYDVNDTTYRTVLEVDAGNDVQLQVIADYLKIEDATDTSKMLTFDLSGATTSTATDFVFAQTANRTITFPDITGTVQLTPATPTTYTPSGTTETITFTQNNRVAIIDLGSATGDVTLTINGMVAGNDYLIKTIQGATARNLIFPASVIGAELLTAWDTSTNTLTLTATDDAKDVVGLTYDGTDTLLTAEFNLS